MSSVITLNEHQRTKIMAFLRTCPGIYAGQAEKTVRFLEAILWLVRSGAQWELIPERYGQWNRIYKRHPVGTRRWCDRGIFEQMHAHFADDPDGECLLLDSTIIRAHPCAAGAPVAAAEKAEQALGRSRGGFSTKIHVVVDALAGTPWVPLDFVLTAGQAHDITQGPALLEGRQADYVIADKGYDSDAFIEAIDAMGAIPVLPARKNRTAPRYYDIHLSKERHLVECFINKIKWYRRIFARFDKLAKRFLGFLSFVSALIWLR